jgi:hypothetical protein
MDNNGELEQLTLVLVTWCQNEYTSYNFSDSCHVINSVLGLLDLIIYFLIILKQTLFYL